MSLYEDMAPWNIFYEAGKLIYIDYDTRNLVFDEAVSALLSLCYDSRLLRHGRSCYVATVSQVKTAYQVIEVLMNYKRTVQDFKRCDGSAQTKYVPMPLFVSDSCHSDITNTNLPHVVGGSRRTRRTILHLASAATSQGRAMILENRYHVATIPGVCKPERV
jgi:hypothetical protein